MKALLLSLLMIVSPLSANVGSEVYLLTDSAYVYADADYASEKIAEVHYNDKFTIQDSETTNGFYYISFTLNEVAATGYISADVVGEKAPAQDVVLSYNAKMLNDSTVLNITDDSEICSIKKGQRVLLFEGYSNKTDYVAVKFVQDGKVIIGKVKTEDVKPDGVNSALIISLTAITALVSVVLILLGITKKKRHKLLKK